MAGAPAEIVSRLGASGAEHLYVDGGVTIQGFLRAGLVQRLIITHVPVLIGTGVPLFADLAHDIRLDHIVSPTRRGLALPRRGSQNGPSQ